MTAADLLLESIADPGRTLALCDETDITIDATSTMLAGIHACVAMIMPSESYPALRDAVLGYQAEHDVPEFHGNEIVNAGKKSAWKLVSFERRLDAWDFACGLVLDHAAALRSVHIAAEQYQIWVDQGLLKPGSQKDGVKEVFAKLMVEYLADRAPALLVFDKEKNNPTASLVPVPAAPQLAGGGILLAPSHMVPGLQVADVAAYAIGRYIKRKDRLVEETANAFDHVAEDMVESLGSRYRSLIR